MEVKQMRTTNEMLNNKITHANEVLQVTITNRIYNGYNHLQIDGENLYTGTKRECIEFLSGLMQYKFLTE